ncbi:uncharacterized protein LOC142169562 [Nicotiana tabacum]|uniref:Uncharacterized protein LOC142169562 n=1 Tax=Nicotiana tabacum TaxID=4097 RepID=A0AC58SRD9_TOBAC
MVALDINNLRHPLYLQSSDSPGNVIISVRLTSMENYSVWRRAMKIMLRAKQKLGFITGTCTKDQFTDDLGEDWERVNTTVLTWIMNTVSPELVNGIVYASNAHEVWTDLHDHFDKINGSRIYNLYREIGTVSQGTSSISAYHSRLKLLWDEYSALVPTLPVTPETREFITHLEQQKLFQFLMGLNDRFSAIRSQMLLLSPSPSVSHAYAMLIHEESQRKVSTTTTDSNVARQGMHNYFTNEQYNKIMNLLNQDKGEEFAANMAGATNHMTSNINLLTDVTKLPNSKGGNVHLPNEKSVPVVYQGKCSIKGGKSIHNVLCDLCIGKVKEIGKEKGGLYVLLPDGSSANKLRQQIRSCLAEDTTTNNNVWHRRLVHVPVKVFLMKLESDTLMLLKSFIKMVNVQFNHNVKCFKTNNGVEFFSSECATFLSDNGILHQSSFSYTPQ